MLNRSTPVRRKLKSITRKRGYVTDMNESILLPRRSARVLQFAAVLVFSTATYSLANAAAPVPDLTGQWMTSDIQCPVGKKNAELLTIVQLDKQVMAVKITESACVPAGYKLFQGPLTSIIETVTCFGGTPLNPASTSTSGQLFVIDANTIQACNATFVRTAPLPATAASVTPSQIGVTPSTAIKRPPPVPLSTIIKPLPKPLSKFTPTGPTKASRLADVEKVIDYTKSQFATGGIASGATAVFETYNSLNAGTSRSERLGQLLAGHEYSVVVICDTICGEVSLGLFDGSSTPAGSNSGTKPIGGGVGSTPTLAATQVVVTPQSTQLYSARVTVARCATNPCEWGLLVSDLTGSIAATKKAPATVNPTPAQNTPTKGVAEVQALMVDRRLVFGRDGGSIIYAEVGANALGYNQWVNVQLGPLSPGVRYGFMGVCDANCQNFDMWLMDGNGNIINSAVDMDLDPEPEINFWAVGGQQYWIRMHMVDCRASSCDWGLVGASF